MGMETFCQKYFRFVDNHERSSKPNHIPVPAAGLLYLLHLLYALRHTLFYPQQGVTPFSYCCHFITEQKEFTQPCIAS